MTSVEVVVISEGVAGVLLPLVFGFVLAVVLAAFFGGNFCLGVDPVLDLFDGFPVSTGGTVLLPMFYNVLVSFLTNFLLSFR